MINVLYIVFAYKNFDGATYSLMDLIESVKGKVNPIVLVPRKGCVYNYFIERGVECITADFKPDLCTDPHTLKQYIGFIARYIPSRLRYFRARKHFLKEAESALKGRKIDIVHINSTILTPGMSLAKSLGVKSVWHLRGYINLDFGWRPLLGWRNYYKELLDADAIIGITPSIVRHYKLEHSENAFAIFDAVKSKKEGMLRMPKEPFFLFCASILTTRKGTECAIEAFYKSELYKQGYNLKIIGKCDSAFRKRIAEIINHMGICDYVDILPFSKNLNEVMEKATGLLMCSENEGLGRVTVEAMFAGCPVIGRNSGGTKDIIDHQHTGFLFNDTTECADYMNELVVSDNTSMILAAQKFAKENFSKEDYGNKILDVYASVLTDYNL